MLIISDFHDYYDTSIGYGVDKKIVYKRTTQEFFSSRRKADAPVLTGVHNVIRQLEDKYQLGGVFRGVSIGPYSEFYVGFCGKVYIGLYARVDAQTRQPITRFTWKDLQKNHPIEFYWQESDFLPGEFEKPRQRGWQSKDSPNHSVQRWFEKNPPHVGHDFLDVFTSNKVASFVHFSHKLVVDPRLKDYEFQRVMGSVEAFQEIGMFISGVLGLGEREMIVTEDKYIALSKGFDQHSFRRAPTKRRS